MCLPKLTVNYAHRRKGFFPAVLFPVLPGIDFSFSVKVYRYSFILCKDFVENDKMIVDKQDEMLYYICGFMRFIPQYLKEVK